MLNAEARTMKLRKNLTAKIVAVLASALTLGAVLGLVHRNPPLSNTDAATSTGLTTSATSTPRTSTSHTKPKQSTTTRHTRTHVS
jgi:hypothetical protein